jgi:hypothetical protein
MMMFLLPHQKADMSRHVSELIFCCLSWGQIFCFVRARITLAEFLVSAPEIRWWVTLVPSALGRLGAGADTGLRAAGREVNSEEERMVKEE